MVEKSRHNFLMQNETDVKLSCTVLIIQYFIFEKILDTYIQFIYSMLRTLSFICRKTGYTV